MENLNISTDMEITKNLDLNSSIIKNSIDRLTLKMQFLLKKLSFRKTELKVLKNPVSNENINTRNFNRASASTNLYSVDDKYSKFNECLDNMPTIQRKAFKMKTFAQYKTAFICKDLGITEDAFWGYISKSRKELMIALDL